MNENVLEEIGETPEVSRMNAVVNELLDSIMTYRRGNTELLLALAKLVLSEPQAGVNAISLLKEAGYWKDGKPDLEALQSRDDRHHWTDLVTKLVSDPVQAAKLLEDQPEKQPFGSPQLLHLARTLAYACDTLPASAHATTLGLHASMVSHALQQLQETGDYYWPRQVLDVTGVTTAYEQGFGHANRPELSNPYEAGTHEAEAWDIGRAEGAKRADRS